MPPAEALAQLAGPGRDPDPAARRALLMRPDLPDEAFALAAGDPDPVVRALAVGHSRAPWLLVEAAAADPEWQVRVEVARRDDCPPNVLERFSHDPDPVVRRAAIAHPRVPVDVLLRTLLRGRSRLDAEFAAKHAALVPDDHVDALLSVTSYGARGLLHREDLPGVLVRAYAGATHPAVVRRLAVLHPNCPPDVLGYAAVHDAEPPVRAGAAAQARCPGEALAVAADDPENDVRLACAGNAVTPEEAVDRLAGDPDERIRRAAVQQPVARPTTLARLIEGDPSLSVRRSALGNPACPSVAVDQACRDADLVHEATANARCTRDGYVIGLATARGIPRPRKKEVQKDGDRAMERDRQLMATAERCLRAVGRQPWDWLSAQPLERLDVADLARVITRHLFAAAGDERAQVRLAVCRHPHTAPGLLAQLAADPDPLVRETVSRRILDAALGAG
ncbi:MAG: hypothetical protein Q7V58_00605 [Actinomycetota bacterium]|nr:hypothetical protein [Actinomycetota bacterium]